MALDLCGKSGSLKKAWPAAGLFALWVILHLVMVGYGTHLVPLYSFYASSDEQAPILGVMHMLESKSLLGMRGHDSVYYGPVFSLIAAPAVALDIVHAAWSTYSLKPEAYKIWFSFNWGSVLFLARWTAVMVGFLGLAFTWRLCNLAVINPSQKKWAGWLGTLVLGSNFYYFLYSGWLRHWIFMTTFFIIEIYFILQIKERDKKRDWIWLVLFSTLNFGISFFNSLLFQIMWLPILYIWWQNKEYHKLKNFGFYAMGLVLGMALILFWNYTPYLRLFLLSKQPGLSFGVLPSLDYYLKIIVFNQPFLSFGFILALVLVFFKQRLYKAYWFWVMALGGLAHLFFVSSNVHAEPRYVMPTTVAIVLLTVCLLVNWRSTFGKPWLIMAVVLLGLEMSWQSMNVFLWLNGAAQGPEDRHLIAWLGSLSPDKKVLVNAWHFLGAAHSKEIIKAYAQARFGENNASNMLTYFAQTDPPVWTHPISNVDYLLAPNMPSSGTPIARFDYLVDYTGEPLATNYFEERLTRLWYQPELRLKYFVTEISVGSNLKD